MDTLNGLTAMLFLGLALVAAPQRGVVRGRVTDESGAVVVGATVRLSGAGGGKTTKTGLDGGFVFS